MLILSENSRWMLLLFLGVNVCYFWNRQGEKGMTEDEMVGWKSSFSSSHVWIWELNHKESWAPKNWFFWTVVLEKTLESPLDCKEIKPVNPKENQSWIFTGRTDAEAEGPILWSPDVKNWLIGKDSDAGKYWTQEDKGMTEDEMVGWHHRRNGHKFEQTLEVDDGQENLASMRSERVRHDWETELELNWIFV